MNEKQNEHGFGWTQFEELTKNHFYPISLQKAKEKEFLELEQGRTSVVQYASKFMELSHFAAAYMANEILKMIQFEFELNHKLKVTMSVCPYSSYQEMYDTAINLERAHNEREAFFNKQGDNSKARPQDHQN